MTPFRFTFQAAARTEFIEAIAWYEAQQAGLGEEFADEVSAAVQRAQAHPEMFPQSRGSARRIRLHRFKAYSVHFAIKGGHFSVVAVFHGARNPADLARRLKSQPHDDPAGT